MDVQRLSTEELIAELSAFAAEDGEAAALVADLTAMREVETMGDRYAVRAAEGILASLEYYGDRSPAVSDGRMATPAYYANRLGRVLAARGDSLPGDAGVWWGHRWAEYARGILA